MWFAFFVLCCDTELDYTMNVKTHALSANQSNFPLAPSAEPINNNKKNAVSRYDFCVYIYGISKWVNGH